MKKILASLIIPLLMFASMPVFSVEKTEFIIDDILARHFVATSVDYPNCTEVSLFNADGNVTIISKDSDVSGGEYSIQNGEIIINQFSGRDLEIKFVSLINATYTVSVSTLGRDFVDDTSFAQDIGLIDDIDGLNNSAENLKNWVINNHLPSLKFTVDGRIEDNRTSFDGAWRVANNILFVDLPQATGCVDYRAYKLINNKLFYAEDAAYTDLGYTVIEVGAKDTDGDGLRDVVETNTGFFVSLSNTGTNPQLADTDGDNLNDRYEVLNGLSPFDDGRTEPSQGASGDPDVDGFSNLEESLVESHPLDFRSRPVDSQFQINPGFHLLFYPLEIQPGFSAFDLLKTLNTDENTVNSVRKLDKNNLFQVAILVADQPQGSDFELLSGEGVIADIAVPAELSFTGAVVCKSADLIRGLNTLGLQCIPAGYSAFKLLTDLGTSSEVATLQRFNNETGRFDSAYYTADSPDGLDFPVLIGEAYLVHMLVDRPGFDPLN